MNSKRAIITNSDKNNSGYVSNFREGSIQDIAVKLMQTKNQTFTNSFFLFQKLHEMIENGLKKVLDNVLPNNKYINGGTVATDGEFSYNVKNQFFISKGRSHTIDPERHLFTGCNRPDPNKESAETYLISCRTPDNQFHNGSLFSRNQYIPSGFREGEFVKKTGNKIGCGLIELTSMVTGCDQIDGYLNIFNVLEIDVSASRVNQSQILDGYHFVENAESYSVPVEFYYDERVFRNASMHPQYTRTGKLSFWLLILDFKDEKLHVFVTLQHNEATGENSWKLIAPPDGILTDELYLAHRGKSRNSINDNIIQTHSKRIEELKKVDDRQNFILWPFVKYGEIGKVIGGTGVGKSMGLLEMGVAAAGGGTIGQRLYAPKAVKVHLISAEMSESQISSRLTQLLGYHPNPKEISDNFKITCLPSTGKVLNLIKPSDQQWFENVIQGALVVLVDYLGLVVPSSTMSSVAEWDIGSTFLRMLARKGFTFIIAHQKNKQGVSIGTSRIIQDADFAINLERPENCPAEETHIEFRIEKFRHARGKEHAPFVFKYKKVNEEIQRTVHSLDQDDITNQIHLVTPEEISKFSLKDLHIEMLQRARLSLEPIKAGMFIVAGIKNRSASNVYNAARYLCEVGLLEQHGVGSGTYYTAVVKGQGGE